MDKLLDAAALAAVAGQAPTKTLFYLFVYQRGGVLAHKSVLRSVRTRRGAGGTAVTPSRLETQLRKIEPLLKLIFQVSGNDTHN